MANDIIAEFTKATGHAPTASQRAKLLAAQPAAPKPAPKPQPARPAAQAPASPYRRDAKGNLISPYMSKPSDRPKTVKVAAPSRKPVALPRASAMIPMPYGALPVDKSTADTQAKVLGNAKRELNAMGAPSAEVLSAQMTVGNPAVYRAAKRDPKIKAQIEKSRATLMDHDKVMAAGAFNAQTAALPFLGMAPRAAQSAVGLGFGAMGAKNTFDRATGQRPGFVEEPVGTLMDAGMAAALPFAVRGMVSALRGRRTPVQTAPTHRPTQTPPMLPAPQAGAQAGPLALPPPRFGVPYKPPVQALPARTAVQPPMPRFPAARPMPPVERPPLALPPRSMARPLPAIGPDGVVRLPGQAEFAPSAPVAPKPIGTLQDAQGAPTVEFGIAQRGDGDFRVVYRPKGQAAWDDTATFRGNDPATVADNFISNYGQDGQYKLSNPYAAPPAPEPVTVAPKGLPKGKKASGATTVTLVTENGPVTVNANRLEIPGYEKFDLYVHEGLGGGGYVATEGTTGRYIAIGTTKASVEQKLRYYLSGRTPEQFAQQIERTKGATTSTPDLTPAPPPASTPPAPAAPQVEAPVAGKGAGKGKAQGLESLTPEELSKAFDDAMESGDKEAFRSVNDEISRRGDAEGIQRLQTGVDVEAKIAPMKAEMEALSRKADDLNAQAQAIHESHKKKGWVKEEYKDFRPTKVKEAEALRIEANKTRHQAQAIANEIIKARRGLGPLPDVLPTNATPEQTAYFKQQNPSRYLSDSPAPAPVEPARPPVAEGKGNVGSKKVTPNITEVTPNVSSAIEGLKSWKRSLSSYFRDKEYTQKKTVRDALEFSPINVKDEPKYLAKAQETAKALGLKVERNKQVGNYRRGWSVKGESPLLDMTLDDAVKHLSASSDAPAPKKSRKGQRGHAIIGVPDFLGHPNWQPKWSERVQKWLDPNGKPVPEEVINRFRDAGWMRPRALMPKQEDAKPVDATLSTPRPKNLPNGTPKAEAANGKGAATPPPPAKAQVGEPRATAEAPKQTVGIKNAALDERRLELGLSELEPAERRGWKEAFETAQKNGYADKAEQIIARKDGLSDSEAAGVAIRLTQMDNAIAKATPEELPALLDQYDAFSQALRNTKAETARALNSFKMAVNKGDYSLADAVQAKRENMGRPLKTAEVSDLAAAVRELETLKAENARLVEENARRVIQTEAKRASGEANPNPKRKPSTAAKKQRIGQQKTAKVDRIRTERAQAIKEFNRLIGRANAGLDPQALVVLGRIARSYAAEGAANLEAVVKMTMADVPNVTREDIVAAINAKNPFQKPPTDAAKATRGVRQEARAETTLTDLNEQIATGSPKPPTPRTSNVVPGSPLEKNQILIKKARTKVRQMIGDKAEAVPLKIYDKANNTLRSMRATADISATLRQGFSLVARDISRGPTGWKSLSKKGAQALKATFNENSFDQIQNAMTNEPRFTDFERSGGHFVDLEGGVTKGEELYANSLAEKIPVLGHVVRGSERHMVSFLNLMRTDAFYKFMDAAPDASPAELKAMADLVNVFTGRGNLGPASQAGKWLGRVFFAPRFAVSRIEAPFTPIKHRKLPRVKAEAQKTVAATAALGGTVLTLAALSGADVEGDPSSPDWGKVRVGDTVYDIWAGYSQPMRLALKLAASQDRNFDPKRDIGNFIGYKAAPALSTAYELRTGKNMVGQKVTKTDIAKGMVTPIGVGDITDAYKAGGTKAALPAGLATMVGVGASTYKKKGRSTRSTRPLGLPYRQSLGPSMPTMAPGTTPAVDWVSPITRERPYGTDPNDAFR
jgi:hypothetical protein